MQRIIADVPKPGASGISEKGLCTGSVGLVDAIVIGISCIAPAYTLTGALGPTVAVVGKQLPAIFIIGFLPMLLTAFGYRELNKLMPDSGTSFTLGARTFGPWIGWMAGWGLVIATVVDLSNLAGIAVDFFYLALSQLFSNPDIAELSTKVWINITTCLAFIIGATWISYHNIHTTLKFQYVLVTYQLLIILGFGAMMFYQAYTGKAFDFTPVELSWFNPANIPDFGTFAAGICLSLFTFWGWDVTLTMSEETKGSKSTPGKVATMTVVIIILIYLFIAIGAIVYAGVGTGELGLGNPGIQENVFFAVAGPFMGPSGHPHVAGHDDLFLLRSDCAVVCVVFPEAVVHLGLQLLLQVLVPVGRRIGAGAPVLLHTHQLDGPVIRIRLGDRRQGGGTDRDDFRRRLMPHV